MWGLIFQLGYAFWVLRDRLLPYVVDERAAGVLRRGRRHICALALIAGTGVVIYHGKSNFYYVSLALQGQVAPRKLLVFLTSKSAHAAAQELAQRLNVPYLADKDEGMWWK